MKVKSCFWRICVRLDHVDEGHFDEDNEQIDRILDAWADIVAKENLTLTTESEWHVETYHD